MYNQESILRTKSKAFALRVIKLYKYLKCEHREHVLSSQILRSGTSIGANIAEAGYAQTTADFVTKLHISLKEAAETRYWIELLGESDYISLSAMESLQEDCEELLRILTASLKTVKGSSDK